ncbi:hypothetical protein Bca4012_100815 [Brassica carinata]|uniref:Uncharacterized protein n=1 Tax=Brassica oleracea var. oleracea TaxID=109376 RepID=A0A0D3CXG6_BRAOL
MVVSAVSYNVAHKIPVIKFHEERTAQAFSQREHSGMSLQHVRLGWEVYDRCFHASGDEKISVGGCIATLLGYCFMLSSGLRARVLVTLTPKSIPVKHSDSMYYQCDWLLGWPPVLSTLDSVHLILPKLAICICIL